MKNIVVIEDDEAVRDNILDTLEASNYCVHVAENGEVGLQAIRQSRPDLILCDVNMPVMDGYLVLRELKRDSELSLIPFVFLTARTERSDLRKGMEMGADDYVMKPFTQRELLQAIDTQLSKREQVAEKFESKLSVLRRNIIYALPHELRTPLTQILGYATLLQSDAATIEPSDIELFAGSILTGGERLQRIIENYLVYAQIEMISSTVTEVESLRNFIIRDAAKIVQSAAEKAAAKYGRLADLVIETQSCELRISEENLSKLLEELIDNAFKFSSSNSKVIVKSKKEDNQYVIGIRDHGRGMSPEQIDEIGAYMQFDRALHEQQGLGMGFVIAKKLVELHAGQLQIKSGLNTGTLLYITFPV